MAIEACAQGLLDGCGCALSGSLPQVQEDATHHRGYGRGGDEEPEVAPCSPGEHRSNGASSAHKGRQTGRDDQETDSDESSDAPPHAHGERQQLTAPVHKYLLESSARLTRKSDSAETALVSRPALTETIPHATTGGTSSDVHSSADILHPRCECGFR